MIDFKVNVPLATDLVIELYRNAGLPRPIDDAERMSLMFANSNLVVSAWAGDELIGVSRCITDFVWSCYLADLVVRTDFQKEGIGRRLVDLTREALGEQSMIILLSVPEAMEYYPKIGMDAVDNGFIFKRTR